MGLYYFDASLAANDLFWLSTGLFLALIPLVWLSHPQPAVAAGPRAPGGTSPGHFAIGWVTYKLFVAPIRTAPMASTVLLTFGLARSRTGGF